MEHKKQFVLIMVVVQFILLMIGIVWAKIRFGNQKMNYVIIIINIICIPVNLHMLFID